MTDANLSRLSDEIWTDFLLVLESFRFPISCMIVLKSCFPLFGRVGRLKDFFGHSSFLCAGRATTKLRFWLEWNVGG